MLRGSRIPTGVLGASLLLAGGLTGQDGGGNGIGAIDTSLPDEGYVSRGEELEIRFTGTIEPGERLAVFVGTLDLSGVFEPVPGGLRYSPSALPLPSGEAELVVYRVGPDESWEEIHRQPLRVRNALGFDRGRVEPRVDLGLEGRLAEGHEPDEQAPLRATYQDFTGQIDLETELARGGFAWMNRGTVIGVDRRENALRFGSLGEDAPRVDLSNYLVRMGWGESNLSIGHVSLGRQRHLISGFTSRGTRIGVRAGSRLDVAAGVVNGSGIVGWSNPLGLADSDHRMVSGSVGLEALDRPGGLRLELSGMSGSRLPLAGFNQGVVNDAEESEGFGVHLQASDPSQRIRLEGGFARSTFDNPKDPTLAQGEALVEVESAARNAHYAEGTVDVLRNLRLGERHTAGLTLGYRHERVAPLYRSLGASVQSDVLGHEWTARATVAGVGLQASHARSEDNLDDLPSVLKSLTRRTGVGASVPLPGLFGDGGEWLPMLAYSFDRTRQFGAELPENGDFSESHVPDQVSRNQSLSADWELGVVRLGYRLDHSKQDNRQVDREEADFSTLVNAVSLGLRPLSSLGIDLSLDLERSENEELDEIERTRRYGARLDWAPFDRSTLAFSVAFTRSTDDQALREREDTLIDAQWSSFVPGLRSLDGRYYLRFSRSMADAIDTTFDLDQHNAQWSLNSGLNLSLFPR